MASLTSTLLGDDTDPNPISNPIAVPVQLDDEAKRPGYRHLTQIIEYYAEHEPTRTWAAIPVDEGELSKGFKDVSYSSFANAINRCAYWLLDRIPESREPFETIAYTGLRGDIRYPIVAMALAKLERKLLTASPSTTVAAQAHLARKLDVRCFLFDPGQQKLVEQVRLESGCDAVTIEMPSVDWLLENEKAEPFLWVKSFEEARHLPWLVLHTGGTTGNKRWWTCCGQPVDVSPGFPKPIVYTHQMMVSFDATELMPDTKMLHDTFLKHVAGLRWYSPLPALHVSLCWRD
jgi:acyl-CoA synthetase (AMP-forming)/AMP-acid ligase II